MHRPPHTHNSVPPLSASERPVATNRLTHTLPFLQLESSRKLSEIKDLHDKIRQSADEAKKKEGLYKQLVGEGEK